jgi:hypothetical protein
VEEGKYLTSTEVLLEWRKAGKVLVDRIKIVAAQVVNIFF